MTANVPSRSYWLQRWTALLLTGILAGLGGMLLALLLHEIQHLVYGYSQKALISPQSFLEGVTDASAQRRFLALLAAGLIAGCGWWLLARYGKKRVSISAAVNQPDKPMPGITTLIHSLLQIITVAMAHRWVAKSHRVNWVRYLPEGLPGVCT